MLVAEAVVEGQDVAEDEGADEEDEGVGEEEDEVTTEDDDKEKGEDEGEKDESDDKDDDGPEAKDESKGTVGCVAKDPAEEYRRLESKTGAACPATTRDSRTWANEEEGEEGDREWGEAETWEPHSPTGEPEGGHVGIVIAEDERMETLLGVVSKSVAADKLQSMTTNLDDNTYSRVTLAEGKRRKRR